MTPAQTVEFPPVQLVEKISEAPQVQVLEVDDEDEDETANELRTQQIMREALEKARRSLALCPS